MNSAADRISSVLAESNDAPKAHLNGKMKVVKSKSLEEQLAEQKLLVAEMEAEMETSKEEEAKRAKESEAVVKKQRLTNDIMNVLKGYGIDMGDLSGVDFPKTQPEPSFQAVAGKTENVLVNEDPALEVKTSNGLWSKGLLFLGLMGAFYAYQNWATLNDSQARILDAAEVHLWTHIWLALGVILFGFGIQYLVFNKQFRYFSNNIDSAHSWSKDFDNPTFEGTVRMASMLLTWLIPTWVCASVMQLILG